MKRLPILVSLAIAAAIGLSGCGSSSTGSSTPKTSSTSPSMSPMSPGMSTSPSTSPGMANMVMISIKNFMYMGPTSVKPGAMVMVTNNDSETHTLTSDQSGLFNVNVTAGGGTAMFNAPTKPGSYAYHCDFHSNMHGTLVVK